jgi:DNA-binding protein Fis
LSLGEVRKIHIQRVLNICQGNRLRAAQVLGIGRTSLYRYLKSDAEEKPKAAKFGQASAGAHT